MSENQPLLEHDEVPAVPIARKTTMERAIWLQLQRRIAANPFVMFWAVAMAALLLMGALNVYEQYTVSYFARDVRALERLGLVQVDVERRLDALLSEEAKRELESMRLQQYSLLQRQARLVDRPHSSSEEQELLALAQAHHELVEHTSPNHHTLHRGRHKLRHHVL